MAKKTTKETGLYADQRGRITCKEHAPLEGSDTWVCDQWKPLTPAEATRFEKEVGRPPACETCVADGGWTEVVAPASAGAAPEPKPASESPAEVEPANPRKGKKAKPAAGDTTLATLAERYLTHLDEVGKSQGTLFSYRLELIVAMEEIGADTKLADLTPERVLAFFICDRVMKTRTGVAKARPTFEKTRRVLRQALVWAAEAGLVAKAPLPEDAATY